MRPRDNTSPGTSFHFLPASTSTPSALLRSSDSSRLPAFEGAAALGEETLNPKREVPRATIIAIIVVAFFYLTSVVGQSLGYGTSSGGVTAFQNAQSAYGELAKLYVGKPLAVLLNLAAALSSIAITLGTMNASARILYATGRSTGDSKVTTRLSRKGEPVVALAITLLAAAAIMIGQRLAGTSILDAVLYWLTIGTLSLLVAYALATAGAMRFLFLRRESHAPPWQIVIPILALLFIGYVLYYIGRRSMNDEIVPTPALSNVLSGGRHA